MLKKIALMSIAGFLVLAGSVVVMYFVNAAPVVPAMSASEASNDASKAAAERVGLGRVFEESGSTGVVLVVDGRTKDVTASIAGSRDRAEYRAAIDASLDRARQ